MMKINSYEELKAASRQLATEIEQQKMVLEDTFIDVKESFSLVNIVSSGINRVASSFNWAQIGLALIAGVRKCIK